MTIFSSSATTDSGAPTAGERTVLPPGVPEPPRGKAGARRTRTALALAAFLVAAFAYRLGFGLCSEFFFEDETQIFLIGLRHHATGLWPYFGADVVWTKSQIPGALQGLLVGVPMDLVPVPEAPFVLLNLLSVASLALLAWYICRRLPEAPRWLVWGWLMFIPWTLQFSTHVINPSYVLCAAIVFFVGFFEAVPRFSRGLIHPAASFAMMGAGLFWIMQIHMSWPLLGPFLVYALWSRLRQGGGAAGALLGLLAGSALTGSLLLPTFLKYGVLAGGGGTHRNLTIQFESPATLVSTLARLFSFASVEISRFLGLDSARRLQFLLRHPWLIPFALTVVVAGVTQPVWMAVCWFRRRSPHADWGPLRWLVVWAVVFIYLSYWLVIEPPQAHAFYLLSPIAFVYAFYCWTFIDSPRWRKVAAVVLASSIIYHAGMVIGRAPERSLYKNREVAAAAILHKVPEVLGHRRPYVVEGAPASDPESYGERLAADIRLVNVSYTRGTAGMVLWTMTVRNESRTDAYRDVYYYASYRDGTGRLVGENYNLFAEILQPGQSITLAGVNHGFIAPFETAEITLLRAERLLPLVRLRDSAPQPH